MKKTVSLFLASCFILLVLAVGSCKKSNSSNPPPPTLYDSLGGTAMVTDPTNTSVKIEKGRLGIRSVVDSAALIIAADTAINNYFMVLLAEVTSGNTSGLMALSKNLTDFFCVGTGAKNFTYTGKSMTAAHDPAQNSRISEKVDSGDFDEFVTDVAAGATKNGLPANLIGRLGTIMESLKSQVVQR